MGLRGSCKEVSEILSIAMDRKLTWMERIRMRLHFRICTWCSDHQSQMEIIHKAGQNLDALCADNASNLKLPDSARDRIKCAIKEQGLPKD